MGENPAATPRAGGATFFTKWFWLWLVASAAYALPVAYWADTSRPTQAEITRSWIYDALVLIAAHKGGKENVVEVKRLFPLVAEDQQLGLIAEYWDAEAAAYRQFYRVAPPFLAAVEALNAKYRARLDAGAAERDQAQFVALVAWGLPVLAGLLLLALAYLRRRRP
jgi:hypothetical protein